MKLKQRNRNEFKQKEGEKNTSKCDQQQQQQHHQCEWKKRNTKATSIELYIFIFISLFNTLDIHTESVAAARDSWNILVYKIPHQKWPCTIIIKSTQKFNHEICKLFYKIGVIDFFGLYVFSLRRRFFYHFYVKSVLLLFFQLFSLSVSI